MKRKLFTKVCSFILALSMMLVLAACGAKSDLPTENASGNGEQTEGLKVVTMAISSTWDKLMPFDMSSNYGDVIMDMLFERLVLNMADGTVQPRLAESWSVNEDSTAITFNLNPDAKWHDGTPVTADDVVYTVQMATNTLVSASRRSHFRVIAGTDEGGAQLSENSPEVKKIDDNTVEFTLKSQMDPESFLNIFCKNFYVLPKHILGQIPLEEINTAEFWQKPTVGNGPFIFESMVTGEQIEMKANADYYLGAPKFDKLVIKVVSASNTLAGLISGEIDMTAGGNLGGIPLQDWEMAQAQSNLICESLPTLGYQYMAMNNSREYMTQNVRRAIDMAIDREAIVEQLLLGQGEIAAGPLPQSHRYFNNELLPVTRDVEKAKALLEEEGWDSSRELLMLVPVGNQVREKSAPLIQQNLAEIGVKVKIQTADFPTLLNMVRNDECDLALVGSAGSTDPDESAQYIDPDMPNNFCLLTDYTLANIAKRGAAGLSFEERKPIYDEYQMALKELCPISWLYFANSLMAYNSRLSNIPAEDFASLSWQVWTWEVT